MNNLISYLFKTNAVKVCDENKPFWYTSGKIGPYYINSEFLYGSKEDSMKLLEYVDKEKEDKEDLPRKVFEKVYKQYNENEIFKNVVDELVLFIRNSISINEVDFISGGERRDWFFSYMVAKLLNKPHITIYKDLSIVITDEDFNVISNSRARDAKVLHIADLITEASSYLRAWIPAIKSLGATILWSTVIVDRMQGGSKKLENENIKSYAMVNIDENLFTSAKDMNIISEAQFEMISNFLQHPDETMRDFLIKHPEFLEDALKSDEKTVGRAKLCIDENLYNLK